MRGGGSGGARTTTHQGISYATADAATLANAPSLGLDDEATAEDGPDMAAGKGKGCLRVLKGWVEGRGEEAGDEVGLEQDAFSSRAREDGQHGSRRRRSPASAASEGPPFRPTCSTAWPCWQDGALLPCLSAAVKLGALEGRPVAAVLQAHELAPHGPPVERSVFDRDHHPARSPPRPPSCPPPYPTSSPLPCALVPLGLRNSLSLEPPAP